MLGGMMQSIGVGGTVEASEIGILDSLTIESSDTNKPYIIMQESGNSGDFVFGRGSTAVSGGGADDLGIRTNSGNMLFATGGVTERMRIDSTGNVGIGTTAPDSALEVAGTGAGTTLTVTGVATNSGDDIGFINFANDIMVSGEVEAYVGAVSNSGGRRRGELVFGTGDASSNEKMRIDYQGNVGIGTTNPSAKLDITSTTGGFLPPRMTTTQRNAISSPATGLVIYNTTDNVLNFYNGTSWGAV